MPKSFKPGIALTVCTLLGLIVLIGLGTWQARKIGPKADLLARIEGGLAATPIQLPVHLDDPSALDYHRVTFVGHVLDRAPIKVFATSLTGKSGYHIYAPVQKQHGMAVAVNFGWIPFHQEKLPALPSGDIAVTGVLRTSATPGSMTPPNVPEKGQWFTADVHEMAAHWGLRTKEYYHFRIFSDHIGAADSLPQGGQVRVDIPNDHLQYAITWFGLAATLLGVYIAFGFKRGREE